MWPVQIHKALNEKMQNLSQEFLELQNVNDNETMLGPQKYLLNTKRKEEREREKERESGRKGDFSGLPMFSQ